MKKLLFLLIIFSASTTLASEPKVWSVNTLEDVLKGESKGVSISDSGTITVAPKFEEIYNTEEQYIWSSDIDNAGNIFLGTGGEGKIFRVDKNGNGELFADTEEINVSSIVVSKDGSVFAGTSPDGKVYKFDPSGNRSIYFEPKEKYIWALEFLSDGSLAVATGETGKIYQVKAANADPRNSLIFDSSETNIVSLLADSHGNLYAGTDPNGYVLRFSKDGNAFAILDSELTEVHELAEAQDGSIYALAIAESASSDSNEDSEKQQESRVVSVGIGMNSTNPASPASSKSTSDLSSAKSAVYRIKIGAGNDLLWKSVDTVAFSISENHKRNGVYIGTSDRGKIYDVKNDGIETLALQTGEDQVSTIRAGAEGLIATTSNTGKVFSIQQNPAQEGIYESPILNANSVANWGEIWWRSSGDVTIETRSGNTKEPNELWTDWNSIGATKSGRIASPSAQYLQWRAVLKGTNAELFEVNASFIQQNIAPEIQQITILAANVGLVPPPAVFVDPNIESVGLDPSEIGITLTSPAPRKIFQSGSRSFTWKGFDRNGDDLVYSIYYRLEGSKEFRLLRENIETPFFSVDGISLADGRYRIKIVASDERSNSPTTKLQGERISEPFDIDNTNPNVNAIGEPTVNQDSVTIKLEATEESSRIVRAEYSIDGGEWKLIVPEDGISDGKRESYRLSLELKNAGLYTVGFRAFDSSGNSGSTRISVRK